MKFKLLLLGLSIFVSSILIAQEDYDLTTLKKVGDNIPSFKVKSILGKTLSSNELNGKVILINFWATWCPPCRTELPLLQKNIYDKIKDKNFEVLVISRAEKEEVVKKFIEQNKYTFPVYLDGDAAVYNLFADKYIPRNFVIGKNGKIKWASIGFRESEFKEMVELIEMELKK